MTISVTGRDIEVALGAIPGGLSGTRVASINDLADGAEAAMRAAGINTHKGKAVFLAQVTVESAYFRSVTEYGGASTSYAPYYGRGFIQMTHRSNYAAFGRWCKARGLLKDADYFVKNPSAAARPRWAWTSAVWYLSANNLVDLANRGEIDAVGMGVHAGDIHADRRGYPWTDYGRNRVENTRKIYRALMANVPSSGGTSSSSGAWRYDMPHGDMSVKEVQKAAGVTADGVYGPSTRRAVKRLQRRLKVKPRDGLWGPSTEKAYRRSLRKDNLLERGDRGRKVRRLQRQMNRIFPAYSRLKVDGIFGKATEDVIETFQRRAGIAADGVVGPRTRRALRRSGVTL